MSISLEELKGKIVIGIDEVGRGCWAGPMVVGAVILEEKIAGLNDSKLLSKAVRQTLAGEIKQFAIAWSTGWVTAPEIDRLGLTAATKLAIERALKSLKQQNYEIIIIDGSINYLSDNSKAYNLIRADSLLPAVSAASIIAKSERDKYMFQQALQYPEYGFDRHVGYGTAFHRLTLVKHGITPLHRKSYKPVRKILESSA